MSNRRKFFAALASVPAALLTPKPQSKKMVVTVELAPLMPDAIAAAVAETIRRNRGGITDELLRQAEARQLGIVSR